VKDVNKNKKLAKEIKNGATEQESADLIDVIPDEILEKEENLKEAKGEGTDEQTLEGEKVATEAKEIEELRLLKEQLEKKENELKEYIELSQRVKAEFDNYRKRTAKEKEQLYCDIIGEIITKFFPVIDNLERALISASDLSDISKLSEGVDMTVRQFKDILAKEGIEEIDSINQEFDPNFHNAVMHVEDESLNSNTVVEVFQKGYKIKDRVLRHCMVKVCN
jgi:molecular chaperone GrpE